MISSYIGSHQSNWDQFLQYSVYQFCTAVHQSTGKTTDELFLGKKIITPFQMLLMVSGVEGEFMCQNVEKLVKKTQVQIGKAQKGQALYYDMRRRELDIKVGDFNLVEKHWLSSCR